MAHNNRGLRAVACAMPDFAWHCLSRSSFCHLKREEAFGLRTDLGDCTWILLAAFNVAGTDHRGLNYRRLHSHHNTTHLLLRRRQAVPFPAPLPKH